MVGRNNSREQLGANSQLASFWQVADERQGQVAASLSATSHWASLAVGLLVATEKPDANTIGPTLANFDGVSAVPPVGLRTEHSENLLARLPWWLYGVGLAVVLLAVRTFWSHSQNQRIYREEKAKSEGSVQRQQQVHTLDDGSQVFTEDGRITAMTRPGPTRTEHPE